MVCHSSRLQIVGVLSIQGLFLAVICISIVKKKLLTGRSPLAKSLLAIMPSESARALFYPPPPSQFSTKVSNNKISTPSPQELLSTVEKFRVRFKEKSIEF